jgi:hypothetical protein
LVRRWPLQLRPDPTPYNWGKAAAHSVADYYWNTHHQAPLSISDDVTFCQATMAQNANVAHAKALPGYAWDANGGDQMWMGGCEVGVEERVGMGRIEITGR